MDPDCEVARKRTAHGVPNGFSGVLYRSSLQESYKLATAVFLCLFVTIFFWIDVPAFELTLSFSTGRPVIFAGALENNPDNNGDGEPDEAAPEVGFRKRYEVRHIDCARLLNGDEEYVKTVARNRPAMLPRAKIDMSCDAIKARVLPARNNNTGFPIAFAKIVYMDYLFLEEQLAVSYAEENLYCFIVDQKAPKDFHDRFDALSKCLPNVVIAPPLFTIDQAGHNQNMAHMECMRKVMDRKWNYIILQQNHDLIIKTHQQITQILKIYDGANDVEEVPCPEKRCLRTLETHLGKLGLCPKHMPVGEKKHCQNVHLKWGKGLMQMSLSRAAVEYIFNELNITALSNELNAMGYGVDEELFETINLNPELKLPGGFTTKCLGSGADYVSRFTIWSIYDLKNCKTNINRHSICLLGVEHLKEIDRLPHIMANKSLPDFDYAAITCIAEMLYNRTRGLKSSALDTRFYNNLNLVRYHKEKKRPGFDEKSFKCHIKRK